MRTKFLMALAGALVIGCGGESHQDLRQFVKDSGNGLPVHIDPLPQAIAYEPVTYAAFELPNPFEPRKVELAKGQSSGLQPDLNRRKEPLEAFPLDNLKMVGTLYRDRITYALVRTPDNTIYRVKTGNYMGQDFGIAAEISDAAVNLKEIVQDGAGDWTERASSLLLQDEQEQKK